MPEISLDVANTYITSDTLGYKGQQVVTVQFAREEVDGTISFLSQALAAAGISYGDSFPGQPQAVALNITAKPMNISNTIAKVVATYGPPEEILKITVSGSGGQKTFSYDPAMANGPSKGLLQVIYTAPAGPAVAGVVGLFAPGIPAEPQTDYAKFQALSPNTILTIDWLLPADSPNAKPMANGKIYRRMVNSAEWQGGAKWTWLCREFDGTSVRNQTYYQMKMSWEYDPDTWVRQETFVDKKTGKVPTDVNQNPAGNPGAPYFFGKPNQGANAGRGNGTLFILPYGEVDFTPLNIPTVP